MCIKVNNRICYVIYISISKLAVIDYLKTHGHLQVVVVIGSPQPLVTTSDHV